MSPNEFPLGNLLIFCPLTVNDFLPLVLQLQGDAIVKSKERSVRESVCARVSCFAERTQKTFDKTHIPVIVSALQSVFSGVQPLGQVLSRACGRFCRLCLIFIKMAIDVEALISLVFSRKPLWDQQMKLYKNKVIADKLWRQISTELGNDVTSNLESISNFLL